MNLRRPLCVLCWIVSLPLALALLALSVRGADAPAESLPAGLNVVAIEVNPAAVELKHKFDYRQLLISGKLATGETVDLSRMAKPSQTGSAVTVSGDGLIRAKADGTDQVTFTYGSHSVSVPVTVAGFTQPHTVSYVRDVQPALSRMGCNAGTCHGAREGKAGFKLSLRGYDALYDHRAFTDDIGGRRFNRAAPDQSLMLLKATGSIPHVGGVRTEVGQPYYDLVRDWITQGVKLDLNAPRVAKIDVLPLNPIVPLPGMKQQVTVIATYTDGLVRDVTREAFIESGNIEIIEANTSGVLTTLRRGEAPVLVRYEGAYAATTIIVMGDRTGFAWEQKPQYNYIDQHVDKKLQFVKIVPSDLCADGEFVRRVYIDLTGLPPSSQQVRAFLDDPAESRAKREALVDQLVGSREYVEHWTNKWADMLQVNRKFLGEEGSFALRNWIKESVASNKPYDQMAREIITANGSNLDNPPAAYWKIIRDPASLMENTTHLFLAVRFNCNKCHDHPFERWTQDQYYQLSQYFAQVGRKPDQAYAGQNIGGSAVEGAVPLVEVIYNAGGGDVNHDRTGQVVPPKFPYELPDVNPAAKPAAGMTAPDRREQLAQWVTSPQNQYFAKSYVNRLWGYLFGVGIIEPIDDIRAGNPATNPELLDALTKDFIDSKFDAQHMLRTICKSRTYQLAVATNKWNEDDTINYSHTIPRRLPAEVLYDAIYLATGAQKDLPGVPAGFRAAQLPDAGLSIPFLDDFGRPVRESACECERSSGMVLGPIMKLINGPTVADALVNPASELNQLVATQPDDGKLLEELFIRFLGRKPSEPEMKLSLDALQAATADQAKAAATLAEYEQQIPAKQAAWEASVGQALVWRPLDPSELKSAVGATLTKQEDKSVVATGAIGKDVYTFVAAVDLQGITAIRLEAITDAALAAGGPGRAQNGNFVVSGIKGTIAPQSDPSKTEPVEFQNASADFSQDAWPVSAAIDGSEDTGWAVSPQLGKTHEAIFETKADAGYDGGSLLTIYLSQQYPDGTHVLGKFRISVTNAKRPIGGMKLPEAVAAAVAVPKDQRSADQLATLVAHYRTLDGEFTRLNSEAQRAAEQAKNARAIGIQDLGWALINNPAFLFNR